MFIYLSKKIAIPQGIKLQCVSWNSEQGWISCGGGNGLLKVLKLESRKAKGPSNLSMNQTLEGHNGDVCVVTWNENYRKLTTSDQYGLIIVWMLHKSMWFEEMINNRNKSVVRDMKWTGDGQKICIVYEDGAVIVGSVDGNRLWGKELDIELALVEWSPDGRNILFGSTDGRVHVYDNLGIPISTLSIYAVEEDSDALLVGIHWYNGLQGYIDPNVPSLAICYDNGCIQVMRDDTDDNPVLIDTGIQATKMRWNINGSVLAVAGTKAGSTTSGEAKDVQMVQFYNPWGKHLRTLKVPGSGIQSISWEGGSLRLALAVDSFIYFANIRPDYEWGFFADTLVYSFSKPDRAENCVLFWDTNTDERHVKYVKHVLAIRAAGENCVFVTRTDDQSGLYILILCNAIGSPVDSKYTDVEPLYIAMTPFHIIVASETNVYVWQYRTPVSKLTSMRNVSSLARAKDGREQVFHVDDAPTSMEVGKTTVSTKPTSDPICAVTASVAALIVARQSGSLVRYGLPHLAVENKYAGGCLAQALYLNCDSTMLGIININGQLSLFDLDKRKQGARQATGEKLEFDRKDCWDMLWSDDNPQLFAVMEKTRMYIFRGTEPEEPVVSNGYLCSFSDLCIKAVLMDDIIIKPEDPKNEFVVKFDTKSLRDTRQLIESVPISEVFQFVEDHPHPRLWRDLAEASLEQLNFIVADKAFVRCNDFQGIQFVKRLKMLSDPRKQKAEVAAYFRRFDEAEGIYLSLDENDAAVELRMRLGDWFRVVQLIQSSNAGDDALLTRANDNIGHYYADRQKWGKALKYFQKSRNHKEVANCAYILDDYETLTKLLDLIPEGSDMLRDVAEKLLSVGLCAETVTAYNKAGDPKAAIDACVTLNQWDQAVELAEKHNYPQIEGLLTKYASHLLSKKKLFQAVELYRKACRYTEAAKMLSRLGAEAGELKVNPLRAKKLYVLAALEVDRFKRKMLDTQTTYGAQTTEQTLASLVEVDSQTGSDKALENPWRGAEAYHFLLLCQRQMYASAVDAAMKTAFRLTDYEDVLDPKDIYSLVALTSFYNEYFETASTAFIRLESLENVSEEDVARYQKVALSIFTKHQPKDPSTRLLPCPGNNCHGQLRDWSTSCSECGKHFAGCIITGRSILGNEESTKCKACKHHMFTKEMRKFSNCPLCHTFLGAAGAGVQFKEKEKDKLSARDQAEGLERDLEGSARERKVSRSARSASGKSNRDQEDDEEENGDD